MSSPVRVQRKRTKGWRMPENTVYVGRPSKWGNPWQLAFGVKLLGYRTKDNPTTMQKWYMNLGPADVVRLLEKTIYDRNIHDSPDLLKYPNPIMIREELAGKNLACWCPLDQPCHADLLLEIANKEPS